MAANREKVRELFLYAVGKLPVGEWDRYVAEACRGDTELQRQTERLLKLHREAGDFMEQPAIKLWDSATAETGLVGEATVVEPEQRPGASIGPYRLLEIIGEGGCGIVFLAEQAQPIRRRVALKVLKPGMDTRNVITRFEAERQALALMDHPYIARIIDGGETNTGRPYFVMELVNGVAITDFCRQNSLSVRARLDLLIAVCQAVQHAHQKGMIHRDLKPTNVLVTRHDGKPVVKVIDFGIAKLIGQQQIEETLFATPHGSDPRAQRQPLMDSTPLTGFENLIGTPLYMSPEQAGANGLDIDTRSDIYSLGALLYELLTGTTPFEREELRGMSYTEMRRLIREKEPPRPSTRIDARGGAAIAFAAQCESDPKHLSRLLRNELDWIAMKCLEKDRTRRYDSAAALAEDLGRFQRGEPIQARHVSGGERLWKWARSKPGLAMLLTVCGLLLTTVIVGTVVYDARLFVALRRAEAKEAEARQQHDLAANNYKSARGALNRMLDRLEQRRLGEVPLLKELQRDQRQDALTFYEGILAGADDPDPEVRLDAARACERAANIQTLLDRGLDAVANYRRGIDLIEVLPAPQRDLLQTQRLLAACYGDLGLLMEKLPDAEQFLGKAMAIAERLAQTQPKDPLLQDDLARIEHQLAQRYIKVEKWADAEPLCVRAVELRTALVRDYPKEQAYREALAGDYVSLGLVYGNTGRKDKVIAAYTQVEELLRPLIDRDPQNVRAAVTLAAACVNWALDLIHAGKRQAAFDRVSTAIELADAARRREPTFITARGIAHNAHALRAKMCENLGHWADAVKDREVAVALADKWSLHTDRTILAIDLVHMGDHRRATAEVRAAVEEPGARDDIRYNATCVYSLAIPLVRSEAALSPSERDSTAERYAAEAIALLKRLKADGYFQPEQRIKMLRTDPDLQPLHEKTEFQRLLPKK